MSEKTIISRAIELDALIFVALIMVWPCMDAVKIGGRAVDQHHTREMERLKVERQRQAECRKPQPRDES